VILLFNVHVQLKIDFIISNFLNQSYYYVPDCVPINNVFTFNYYIQGVPEQGKQCSWAGRAGETESKSPVPFCDFQLIKNLKKFLELHERKVNNFCLLLFFCKVDSIRVKNY